MKINLKTNRFFKTATIIYTALLIISLYLEIGHIAVAYFEKYIFLFFLYASYVLMLLYLIAILRTLKEQKTVIAAFIIYTGLELAKIIFGFLPVNAHSDFYAIGLGTFSSIVGMYLIIQTFNIKSGIFAVPYRVFGGSLAVSIIAFFYLTSSSPVAVNANAKDYLDIAKVLVPLAALFILKNVDLFIKDNDVQKAQVTSN